MSQPKLKSDNPRSEAAERLIAFCTEAAVQLGYGGDKPVEFWTGCIIRYLELHRPESRYIRLRVPLTIFCADYPELTQDLCRHLQEHGDAEFRYQEVRVN
jgi:hypothetical protein